MTAQSSANGVFYKFLPYYRNKLRNLRPQLIMSIIFGVLSYPLVAGIFIPMCQAYARNARFWDIVAAQDYEPSTAEYIAYEAAGRDLRLWESLTVTAMLIGLLCLMGIFVFTFVTTVKSFRYLYNKSVVDMDYSLPVSHETRFFGDLAAVFTVNILPHLASILLGVILFQFCDKPEFTATADVLDMIIPAAFTGLFACIMEVALTLLMLSFCGRMAEACIYPILVNFAIPMIHCMGLSLIESGVYGSVVETSAWGMTAGSLYPMTASSPLGMIIMTFYSMATNDHVENISDIAPIFRPEYGIPALLVTLACIAGAYFLIKYRRAERVGMPYVYKGMGLVIPGVVIFAVTVTMGCTVASIVRGNYEDYYSYTPDISGIIIGTVIATFIMYIIMDLISGRGFRKFYLTAAKWAGTLGASVLICLLLNLSNGFGAANYVPAPSSVKLVSVSYMDHDDFSWEIGNFKFTANSGDTELLELANHIHSEIPKHADDSIEKKYSISVEYTLKDGRELARFYYVTKELYDDVRSQMLIPEAWFKSRCGNVEDYAKDGFRIDSMQFVGGDQAAYNVDTDAFIEAYRQDCQKITFDFVQNNSAWKGDRVKITMLKYNSDEVHGYEWEYLMVYDWMDNTVSLLNGYGISLEDQFDPENYGSAFIIEGNGSPDVSEMLAQSEGISYATYLEGAYGGKYSDGEDYSLSMSYGRVSTDDPEFKKLLEVSGSEITNKGTYTLALCSASSWREYVDGTDNVTNVNLFEIPVEYNAEAEKLLADNLVYEAPETTEDNSTSDIPVLESE
mgnify:CR=1 FL=1